MIPAGSPVLIVVAIRVAYALLARRGIVKTRPAAQVLFMRVDGPLVNVFVRLAFWGGAGAFAALLAHVSPWLARGFVALVVVASFPAWILHGLLIPLGRWRAAYFLALVSPPLAHSYEVRGGAVLVGALALGRRRAVDPAAAAWLEARLVRARSVRSVWMTAAGLLAAARGRPETARRLLHAVDGLSRRSTRLARRVAREWLVADAAEKGDWGDVAALARGRWELIRWPYLMGAIARRLLGVDAPSDLALRGLWLAAPHRRRTLPILRRALAVPRRPGGEVSGASPRQGDPREVLAAALSAHAACLACPTGAALVAAGQAWDAASRAPSVRAFFARRAAALDARQTPDGALERLLETARQDLAPLVAQASPAVVERSPLLGEAAALARRDRMAEIEELVRAMAARSSRRVAVPVAEEWMDWGALRSACDRVNRGARAEARRALFVTVYGSACNHAVWLYNARDQRLLANGMFRWLAREARTVGDAAAAELLEKNVAVGDGL